MESNYVLYSLIVLTNVTFDKKRKKCEFRLENDKANLFTVFNILLQEH